MTRTHRRITALVAAAGLSTALVAGCSSDGSSSSAADAGGMSAHSSQSQAERQVAPGAAQADEAGDSAVDVAQSARKLIRTADLTIRVEQVRPSVAKVHRIIEGVQGYVVEEQVGDDDVHPSAAADSESSTARPLTRHATLTLAVPAERLDSVLAKLGDVGTVTESSTSSEDVTKHYVDTASRITTMQTSVDRLRRLMRDASDLDQITKLESALTTREATLESLKSQMSALKTQVAMATVTVDLSTTAVPAQPASSAPHGFVEGLSTGWGAFASAVAAVITALGVLLPFLLLAALVGVPLVVWLRRRRTTGVSDGSTPAPAP